MSKNLNEVSAWKCFGGWQKIFSHYSEELKCEMRVSVFVPPQACVEAPEPAPVVYYLSGLTCTEENFIQKSGAQRYAAEHGLFIVGPDTSPRGADVPDDKESWDFGMGAGFYVDAVREPWSKNYRMYSYVVKELPAVIEASFPVKPNARAIMGHSMGGHGALICALKNPGFYSSASAFAPICNPSACPWGVKAFTGYLGADTKDTLWKSYDATELVKMYKGVEKLKILIDSGLKDEFYEKGQLLPENFMEACKISEGIEGQVRLQEGYDHSYYFVSSFVGEHIAFHAKNM